MEFSTFIIVYQSFGLYVIFPCDFFATFSTELKSAEKFGFVVLNLKKICFTLLPLLFTWGYIGAKMALKRVTPCINVA